MNSIASDVRTAVFNALSAINYAGGNVPVHLIVPDPPTYPYIEISSIDIDNDSAQGAIEAICSVTLEVVTAASVSGIKAGMAETIEDSVYTAMMAISDQAENLLIISNFERSRLLKEYDGARVIYRKILEYRIETQDT
jgi:hypothetical protein